MSVTEQKNEQVQVRQPCLNVSFGDFKCSFQIPAENNPTTRALFSRHVVHNT